MRIRSFVAALVIAALGSTSIVPAASAGEPSKVPAAHRIDFDKAVANAVEQQISRKPADALTANRAGQPAMQRGYGGGGGGGVMMAMSIVGVLAGIGMTYYMVKQMQKATKETTAAGQ
jgi:hypothetical protein